MKTLLITLLVLLSYVACAQTSIVTGRVFDIDDSTAIIGATVMIDDGKINTMCDQKGYFALHGVPRKSQSISVVLLGYNSVKMPIKLTSSRFDAGVIFMSDSENEIDAVVVKGRAPIAIQKGDTTQFNAEAFKTNPDADADELLVKMPGVVIQDGKVEAQGEPVRRIYVDGRLFFGTNPMAALKNLPADAIESIQLFDEVGEQARYMGIDDGETQKAINIVTKNKNKSSTIFKAETSAGVDVDNPDKLRYLAGGNFSRFTEKHRLTVTALGNNVNTAKFGQDNLIDDSEVDNNGNMRNSPSGVKTLNGYGANYSYDTEKVKLSADYFFDNSRNKVSRESFRSYYPTTKFKSKDIFGNNESVNRSDNHRFNLRFEWKPSENNTIIISPQVSYQTGDNRSLSNSLTIQNGDSLSRNRTQNLSNTDSYNLSGDALWVHRFAKRGRSVSTNINYNISDRESDRKQEDLYRQNYDSISWTDLASATNRISHQAETGNSVRMKISYAEPFASHHRLLFNYIMSRNWGESNKQSHKYTPVTEDYIDKEIRQSNHFVRDYSTIGAGIGYAFTTKIYNLNATLDYQRLQQEREEFEPNVTKTNLVFYDMQPSISFKYKLEKTKYLKIQYRGRTVIPRIEQMQSVIDDTSPSNLRVGNPDLKQGYQNTLTLFYNTTNQAKSTNFTLMLNASTTSNIVATQTESMPADTVIFVSPTDTAGYVPNRGAFLSKAINLNGYGTAKVSASYSMAVSSIRSNLNISSSYGYIRSPSVYGVLSYANIHSGNFRIGLTSNISQNIDFNLYSNTAFNYTTNTERGNTSFLNQNLYYSINVIFLRTFVLNSLLTWKYYKSTSAGDFADSFYLLNIGLGKKLFRRRNGEFRVSVYDLLGQNKNILHYVRNNAVEDARTNTLGRYLLARFSYRFNSMSVNAARSRRIVGDNVKDITINELKKSVKHSK